MEQAKWDIYEAWLNQVEGIGRQKMYRLAASGVSFKEIYESSRDSLHNIHGIQNIQNIDNMNNIRNIHNMDTMNTIDNIRNILNKSDWHYIQTLHDTMDAEALYEKMCQHNIFYVNQKNEDFPSRLKDIPDPPYALYRLGQPFAPGRRRPVIAVIGARMCSEYGKYIAREIGERASELGFEVVSGLARGVDGISQNAAYLAGGEVTAVLGCGVDICYPKENRPIYDGLQDRGRLVSEYAPGTEPVAGNFPQRNRIISGLADAVIVVEAKKRSGTLITVDMALEQGREVYVIPGRVTDPMSYGCNRLIAQGAGCIVDITDTLLELRDRIAQGIRRESMQQTARKPAPCAKQESDNKKLKYDIINGKRENGRTEENNLCKPTKGNASRLGEGAEKSGERVPSSEKYMEIIKTLNNQKEGNGLDDLHNIESAILAAIDVKPKSVQEIYESVNGTAQVTEKLSLQELQSKLIEMELAGVVIEEGGCYCNRIRYP